MISGLLFDFDGTLAELNIDFAAMAEKVRGMGREMGYQGPWPQGYLLEQVRAVSARMNSLGEEFSRRAAALIEEREIESASRGSLFPFSRELLSSARSRGLKLAVVSRNCGAAIRMVFPEVDQAIDAFLPREAVKRHKPHPEHLLAACQQLDLAAERTVMVGDHPTDMQAAQEAGCLAVGVTTGRVDAAGLRQAGARLVLPDASGLLQELDQRT